MDTTEKILLIILASALAVFLILGIAALVGVMRIIKRINHITEKAEQIVTSAETVGSIFRKSAEQMSFVGLIRNVAEMVGQHHKKSHKEKRDE